MKKIIFTSLMILTIKSFTASAQDATSTKEYGMYAIAANTSMSTAPAPAVAAESTTEERNTAYVATGTYKELRDNKVVEKKGGGILMFGGEKVVKASLNSRAFRKIDITKVTSIPVNAYNVEMISEHPVTSYAIQIVGEQVSSIVILDPDKFWSTSRYCVVVVTR